MGSASGSRIARRQRYSECRTVAPPPCHLESERVPSLSRRCRDSTLQPRLLAVRFAVELRLDAPRLAAELGFAAGLAVPGELRSFCSCSRSRRTALFIFSRSRRASRRSLAMSLRRSFLPVRMLPRIAPSSFSAASSAVLIRAIARPFCSKRARAAAVTRGRAAGFLAVALRVDAALGAAVFRALALLTGGIDAPLLGTAASFATEVLTVLARKASREPTPKSSSPRFCWVCATSVLDSVCRCDHRGVRSTTQTSR